MNQLCEMFRIDVPIFAFSHCRDVVVEVSKAGGMGVLGMARMGPERLREQLLWIDDHIDGRPYGIDILMPSTFSAPVTEKFDLDKMLPAEHVAYVRNMLDAAGIAPLPELERDNIIKELLTELSFTPNESLQMLEIALTHPIKLVVSALGSPDADLVKRIQARGIKVAALAGKPQHTIRDKQNGCDFVVAVGTEAGGHTGTVSAMVLWPQVVDAVAPLPVLGAGGVGRGRQVAAALALGCAGVWCGSVWLGTAQSEVVPAIKDKMFAASSEDAIQTRSVTGKPCRTLRSAFTDAYEQPGAPVPLSAPLQNILWWAEGRTRVERVSAKDFLTYPVGQIVGDLQQQTSVKKVIQYMMTELLESHAHLANFIND